MLLDDPAVLAEARAVFDRYEAALMANRNAELDEIFWADPRTVRFGVTEAHGKGMALQFNYLTDKGAFVGNPDGTFAVNIAKMKAGVRALTHDLLTIEAEGNYAGAKKMLETLSVIRPAMQKALDAMKDIPTDIDPTNE